MKKILFMCTGNTCRSPMAQYYMQKRIKDLNKEDEYFIDSCGLYAINGEVGTLKAIQAMYSFNVDMRAHRAKNLLQVNLNDYDLIITFTMRQKKNLMNYCKGIRRKVFTLVEYTKPNTVFKDIADPFGHNLEAYKECSRTIAHYVDNIIENF